MKRFAAPLAILAVMAWASVASAHMFWVNATESFNHPPGHVTTALGFGHILPMDDLLTSEHGVIRIGSYELVGPDGSVHEMELPDPTMPPKSATPTGLTVQSGDIGIRKIALTEDTKPGTYQIAVKSVPMFFTKYKNTKGKVRMAPMAADKIKDLDKVVEAFKYQSFAKAYFAVKQWQDPKPLGHELEILPITDLSKVRPGDLAEFKVLYNGKPLNSDSNAFYSLQCTSNAFGAPDEFGLSAYVVNGTAKFRMPEPGQWVVNLMVPQDVDKTPALKHLKGKCTRVFTAATLFFTVHP